MHVIDWILLGKIVFLLAMIPVIIWFFGRKEKQ